MWQMRARLIPLPENPQGLGDISLQGWTDGDNDQSDQVGME